MDRQFRRASRRWSRKLSFDHPVTGATGDRGGIAVANRTPFGHPYTERLGIFPTPDNGDEQRRPFVSAVPDRVAEHHWIPVTVRVWPDVGQVVTFTHGFPGLSKRDSTPS